MTERHTFVISRTMILEAAKEGRTLSVEYTTDGRTFLVRVADDQPRTEGHLHG